MLKFLVSSHSCVPSRSLQLDLDLAPIVLDVCATVQVFVYECVHRCVYWCSEKPVEDSRRSVLSLSAYSLKTQPLTEPAARPLACTL